jgi:hypothetical protein
MGWVPRARCQEGTLFPHDCGCVDFNKVLDYRLLSRRSSSCYGMRGAPCQLYKRREEVSTN